MWKGKIFYIKQYLVFFLYQENQGKLTKQKESTFHTFMEHNVFFSQHQIQFLSPLTLLISKKQQVKV